MGDDAVSLMEARMAFVEFRDVSKTYRMGEVEVHAVHDMSFEIERGEFVVIVGPSGAGKTTLLNMLGGMDSCTSGIIKLDGDVVSAYGAKQLTMYRRYDIGFVFQFYNLVQNLTARENVELASQICKDPLDVDQVLDDVGLAERKGNFPGQLSGGEQQRVAIARALAKNPKMSPRARWIITRARPSSSFCRTPAKARARPSSWSRTTPISALSRIG